MKETFTKLIEDNAGILFKVCKMYCQDPQDQEDLRQDILLQLWRAYASFKGQAKVSTWMYRIALNTASSEKKQKEQRAPG